MDPATSNPVPTAASPTCVLLVGMAGSGKSTTLARLVAHITESGRRAYVLNLDPAVTHLPYEPNLDIRDTVDYKSVMKSYRLGPNGAIMTSLNLFATKFDQVLAILERRRDDFDYLLVDTPGQIEAFTWSASGAIFTDALAASFPCVSLFVADTPRSDTPPTFMANMLFACSIMYRSAVPFRLLFNKVDVRPAAAAIRWMTDYDAFVAVVKNSQCRRPGPPPSAALASADADNGSPCDGVADPQSTQHNDDGSDQRYGLGCGYGYGDDDVPFINSFVTSTSLFLEEFYRTLQPVAFSAATGQGCGDLFDSIESARQEYFEDYLPTLQRMLAERAEKKTKAKSEELLRLLKDLKVTDGKTDGSENGHSGGGSGDAGCEADQDTRLGDLKENP